MATLHRFQGASPALRPGGVFPASPNVLVAVEERARRRVRTVLAQCRLVFVQTCPQLADWLAREPFDLVLIGSHFNATQGLRALETARGANAGCPILCALTVPPAVQPARWTYAAFRSACLERGAYDTLDMSRWQDDREGNAHVRALIESVFH